MEITASDDKKSNASFYNLDVIIAASYRKGCSITKLKMSILQGWTISQRQMR
jgi:hypothetical protein